MAGWRRVVGMLGLAVLSCGWMPAQDPGRQMSGDVRVGHGAGGATGIVTGRIVCEDTALPARFAFVSLISVASVSSAAGRFLGGGTSGRTDLDGTFTISNAPPGDYYVTAYATGYVAGTTLIEQAANAGEDEATLLASLPQVHVSAGASSTVNFSLSRGATIAGTLRWDDSSPATGVQVQAMLQDTNSVNAPASGRRGGFGGGSSGFANTDDRGQFRLTGLAPGDYVLRALVQAPAPGAAAGMFERTFTMSLYAPGKVRKSEAKTFPVGAGEEKDGVVFTLDLRALHTVTGTVGAVSGLAVESGTVLLTDSVDTTLTRSSVVESDGSFGMSYVPAGTYTLTVRGASTVASSGYGGFRRGGSGSSNGSGASTGFQPFSETVTVTDTNLSGVVVNLTPVTPQ